MPRPMGQRFARGRRGARRSRATGAILACAAATLLLTIAALHAAETQWWITSSPADYAKSEARGLVVRPDGALELGPRARFFAAESLAVVWALAVLGDGSLAVGGDGGLILRWREGTGFSVLARLPVGQVLSLARDGEALVAGTGPDGLLYRIGARGDTALLASTGERYVWGLAPAPGGGWYAATGTRGRLLRVRGSETRTILDTEESNLVSLAGGGRQAVYAGGDSKGRIYRVVDDRELRTVYDASEDEIRALALGADGALYAAALSASAVTEEPREPEQRPTPVRSAVTGGRAVVYRIVPDSAAAALWTSPQPFVFALAGLPDGIVAATGNRAALYLLEPGIGATQWLQGRQGQITALATDAQGRLYAGTSNPGGLWQVGPGRATGGELVSQVFDAQRYARLGALRWRGRDGGGRVGLHTRSGNTETPDTTWSGWSQGGSELRARSRAPAARYFQWRVTADGGAPRISSVEAAWREQNLPPRVEELQVAAQGRGFREGQLSPRSESVTQTLPGGQKVEYSAPGPGSGRALKELPGFVRGLRTLQWRGSDPNGDPLRYTVQVRSEAGEVWMTVGEDLEAGVFTWDTNGLPDGHYRVRVIASDAAGNAVGEGLTGEAVSAPFTVDNTAPVVSELVLEPQPGAVVVSGRAEDAASTLARIEVALDNGDWRLVTPDGGFADEPTLSFRARLTGVAPGEHTLSVRAVDAAGNATTRAGRVTVPRPR